MVNVKELFTDTVLIRKINARLPKLFQIAEIESSRAGKIGMEVGSVREKIIIALLIHKFGEKIVSTKLPITEPETDVLIDGCGLSIKTISGDGGIKAVWTVDAESSKNFLENYQPKYDILLVQIWWGQERDSFFFIPVSVQKKIFKKLGRTRYLKLPKEGTNPRGVEFSKEAIHLMLRHKDVSRISINWQKKQIDYNIYERWINYWD